MNRHTFFIIAALLLASLAGLLSGCQTKPVAGDLEKNFVNPPDSARPGVYWYFMNGNLNGQGDDRRPGIHEGGGPRQPGVPRGGHRRAAGRPGRVHEPRVAGAFRPIRPRRGTPGDRHHPRDRAGLVWQRRPLGQAGASHAAPRLQYGRTQRAAELFGDPSPAGTAFDRVAQDGQPVLRGCGGPGLPQPQTDHCRHRRESAFLQGALFHLEGGEALSAGFGTLCGTGAGGRHPAERDRGSDKAARSPTAPSTGKSRPGNGRSSAWDAASPARAAGPRLPPRWAWSATSSTSKALEFHLDQYVGEAASKDRPARE